MLTYTTEGGHAGGREARWIVRYGNTRTRRSNPMQPLEPAPNQRPAKGESRCACEPRAGGGRRPRLQDMQAVTPRGERRCLGRMPTWPTEVRADEGKLERRCRSWQLRERGHRWPTPAWTGESGQARMQGRFPLSTTAKPQGPSRRDVVGCRRRALVLGHHPRMPPMRARLDGFSAPGVTTTTRPYSLGREARPHPPRPRNKPAFAPGQVGQGRPARRCVGLFAGLGPGAGLPVPRATFQGWRQEPAAWNCENNGVRHGCIRVLAHFSSQRLHSQPTWKRISAVGGARAGSTVQVHALGRPLACHPGPGCIRLAPSRGALSSCCL